ncbi:type II 3-dehydroquinate dehydratase [Rothia sp. P4278]|uniref:type II 3-dehydroquinate dehydratase n=1 Tax=unclassified Rothia (in: high G+C Gram-positive bacteria) TaxID=2689056 RepID=UPI003ACF35A9
MAHRQTASKLISVINGPNLNLLGARKPEVYGHTTLADIEATLRQQAAELGFELSFMQSNHEGDLVDAIQAAGTQAAGIIINPAAYTHTSLALHDALEAAELPVVEVHLSNVHKREPFRHRSFVSPQATAVITGAGAQGYELALTFLERQLRK